MKVPKPRKLPSGSWNVALLLGGENISITRPTAQECAREAALIKAQHKAGVKEKARTGDNMTLGDAIEDYISSRSNVLSPATVRTYRKTGSTRFQNVINKPVRNINWQQAINDECKLVSAKTLKSAWGLVVSVLNYHNADVPKVHLPQVIIKDLPWIEPHDIPRFLEAAKGDLCELSILYALHGLRLSEIYALSWGKVDARNGLIKVEGAVVKGENGLVYKEENKNSSSRRTVPIMIPRLRELLEASETPISDASQNTLCRHINRICRDIGIEPVGTHGLRRSFASLCYHLKLSERETMALGGWGDANTMRKIYIKLSGRDKEKSQNKVAEFFAAL